MIATVTEVGVPPGELFLSLHFSRIGFEFYEDPVFFSSPFYLFSVVQPMSE